MNQPASVILINLGYYKILKRSWFINYRRQTRRGDQGSILCPLNMRYNSLKKWRHMNKMKQLELKNPARHLFLAVKMSIISSSKLPQNTIMNLVGNQLLSTITPSKSIPDSRDVLSIRVRNKWLKGISGDRPTNNRKVKSRFGNLIWCALKGEGDKHPQTR